MLHFTTLHLVFFATTLLSQHASGMRALRCKQNNLCFDALVLDGNPTICDMEAGADAFALCRLLRSATHNSKMTALDLGNCQVGRSSEGEDVMVALVDCLAVNTTLRRADFSRSVGFSYDMV